MHLTDLMRRRPGFDGMDGRFFLTLDHFQVLMSLCMVDMVVESHHQERRDVLGQ
jgi:hypothetical protein